MEDTNENEIYKLHYNFVMSSLRFKKIQHVYESEPFYLSCLRQNRRDNNY